MMPAAAVLQVKQGALEGGRLLAVRQAAVLPNAAALVWKALPAFLYYYQEDLPVLPLHLLINVF